MTARLIREPFQLVNVDFDETYARRSSKENIWHVFVLVGQHPFWTGKSTPRNWGLKVYFCWISMKLGCRKSLLGAYFYQKSSYYRILFKIDVITGGALNNYHFVWKSGLKGWSPVTHCITEALIPWSSDMISVVGSSGWSSDIVSDT